MKHADVKEIREVVQVTGGDVVQTPVSVSMKVAELPTTTQIEVGACTPLLQTNLYGMVSAIVVVVFRQ